MKNEKLTIKLENGELAEAQCPIIVSASRSTDIPAFYADWFLRRLKVGYSAWTNPFNGVRSYVAYNNTRLIVFWSKNPKPLLVEGGCLDYLKGKFNALQRTKSIVKVQMGRNGETGGWATIVKQIQNDVTPIVCGFFLECSNGLIKSISNREMDLPNF